MHKRTTLVLALLLVLTTSLLAGCARGGQGEARPTESERPAGSELTSTPDRSSQPAPRPANVTVADLQVIAEWQGSQVPAYPGATREHFEPFETQVQNGGMMVFNTADVPERIVAFYRGALQALGWQEVRATATKVVAERGEAALTVNVIQQEGQTAIVLMLTDAP